MHTLDRSRPTIGAKRSASPRAPSIIRGYMKQRRAFGAPIAEFQGLRFMLADMAIRTEAARALVYRACALVDEDPSGSSACLAPWPSASRRIRPCGDHRRRAAVGRLRYTKDSRLRIHAGRQNHPDLRGNQSDPTGRRRQTTPGLDGAAAAGGVWSDQPPRITGSRAHDRGQQAGGNI